jgi:hypothetical protein
MVLGSEGRLAVHSPFFGPSGVTLTLGSMSSGQDSEVWSDEGPWPYGALSFQATAFASYVAAGLVESPVHPHHEVVSVLATIDEARRQVAAQAHPATPAASPAPVV